jgi:thiamine biosynthesis lipoprotein
MNRRELLDPNRIAHAAGQAIAVLDGPAAVVPAARELTLLRFARRAMATGFEIALPLGTACALEAGEDSLDILDRLEAQLTVYRDDSDISRFNCYAAHGPMPVEGRLFALLEVAKRIHEETHGAYDIATGALIKAWGFYRRQGRVPTKAEQAEALVRSGMEHICLEPQGRTIQYKKPGIELNLGSIGKGYALDRVGEHLRESWNIHAALLHGGTSSVLGVGNPPGQARGWPVGLGHPWNLKRRLGMVLLRDQALGTSSVTFQHLVHDGRKLGHILDPRTGWPADRLASASAVAPTAAEADALATAFFVLGVEQTRVYCEEHPTIGAVLLAADSNAPPVAMGAVDWMPSHSVGGTP